ncbi:hypothetical protein LTR17_011240 [Elasticomyces elasticus]|nr:hypothetical protein LTR17_011240 [Elasticomyces elasticus]
MDALKMDTSIRINHSTALAHANTFPDRLQLSQSGITITPTRSAAAPIARSYSSGAKLNTKDRHIRSILSSSQLQKEGGNLRFLQSSLSAADFEQSVPCHNGLVNAIIQAYNTHHHLRIRPDDIWVGILTQLSSYINGHGEELRHHFVAHQGKKKLEVTATGDRFTVNFGALATAMGQLIDENVVDPQLREWMMPAFPTTTQGDIFIASVVMMGAMKQFFDYYGTTRCGLPSITLLGVKADYELIFSRLERLRTYGKETARFAILLQPVLRGFIKSFDDPEAEEVRGFWNRVVSHHSRGSGAKYYSGWITAFCFWDRQGKCLAKGGDLANPEKPWHVDKLLSLDGIRYHVIDTNHVPSGVVTVPLHVDDNGEKVETVMVAGSTGIQCLGDAAAPDTMQPQSSWWIFEEVQGDRAPGPMLQSGSRHVSTLGRYGQPRSPFDLTVQSLYHR